MQAGEYKVERHIIANSGGGFSEVKNSGVDTLLNIYSSYTIINKKWKFALKIKKL